MYSIRRARAQGGVQAIVWAGAARMDCASAAAKR
jgi:hypothetical protein